ncbi:unnamed protein product [Vitrella brassicaformis CCMP3155]|uniref:Uncharacterized protein n=1 Tax=Vitrella brassicaformis (strain CCMP3155) TaxID=1169540 RepID=A0A0G4EEC4_VITBC|nr:unnamed protein product [Vitrella brassicaformis CCMP3155]|eukprot:CEL93702.1 unnamed protein product [Vitrella brassicaformis CCMP3155]
MLALWVHDLIHKTIITESIEMGTTFTTERVVEKVEFFFDDHRFLTKLIEETRLISFWHEAQYQAAPLIVSEFLENVTEFAYDVKNLKAESEYFSIHMDGNMSWSMARVNATEMQIRTQ